jgi:predicted transcriptional regulator
MTRLQGELQTQVMAALWRLERGTVEDVRNALPRSYQGAYNTVQTVLNRLADRGLVARRTSGHAIVYRPRLTESQYLSRTIAQTLSTASADARQVALAQLIDGLKDGELSELQRLARQVARRRKGRR